MKKTIILSLIFMISLFFYKPLFAAEWGIPSTSTEITDLEDLPNEITRPVATLSDAYLDRPFNQYGTISSTLYFYDLEGDAYKFQLRNSFADELLEEARLAYISDSGITPAYFHFKAYEEQEPYMIQWEMEYFNGIAISFVFSASNGPTEFIEFYSYTYTVKNSDHISGGWLKSGQFSTYNSMPTFAGQYSYAIPSGSVIEYSLDGLTYERVPEFNQTNSYNQVKFNIGTTEGVLDIDLLYYRQNKYNENLMDEESMYLGEYNPYTFSLRYYSVTSISEIPVGNRSNVTQLPETSGNILGREGAMGTVHFVKEGTNLLASISYGGLTYNLVNNFAVNTDMTIFDNSYEIYYYTNLNEKFIIINHGQESIFTVDNILEDPFIPFTVWNLSTNEVQTFKRYDVYMYSKQEEANNVYAYFYVDNYIIDNLISATVSMKYHYTYAFNNGEEQYYYKVLEADNVNEGGGLAWQYQLAIDIVSYATIPTSGVYGLVINRLVIPFVGSTLLRNTPNKNFNFGSINEIQELEPDLSLLTELNLAYRSKYPDFNSLNNNLKVFKLHLGQFNKTFSTGIKIDQEFNYIGNQKGINVIEFTYMTEGELYTVKGEEINVFFVPGDGTDVDPIVTPDKDWFENMIDILKKAYLIIVVAVWGYTVKYIYPPFEAITGKRVRGLSRLFVALAYLGVVYIGIKWFIDFSG